MPLPDKTDQKIPSRSTSTDSVSTLLDKISQEGKTPLSASLFIETAAEAELFSKKLSTLPLTDNTTIIVGDVAEEGLLHIAKALTFRPKTPALNLMFQCGPNTSINQTVMAKLAYAIASTPSLLHIDFSHTPLSSECIKELSLTENAQKYHAKLQLNFAVEGEKNILLALGILWRASSPEFSMQLTCYGITKGSPSEEILLKTLKSNVFNVNVTPITATYAESPEKQDRPKSPPQLLRQSSSSEKLLEEMSELELLLERNRIILKNREWANQITAFCLDYELGNQDSCESAKRIHIESDRGRISPNFFRERQRQGEETKAPTEVREFIRRVSAYCANSYTPTAK